MVRSVLRMLVPFSFMSTVRMPLVLAVLRLALTESIVKAYGARHVTLAVPAVMAVVSSESAMQNSAGMCAISAALSASMDLNSATVMSLGFGAPVVLLRLIVPPDIVADSALVIVLVAIVATGPAEVVTLSLVAVPPV